MAETDRQVDDHGGGGGGGGRRHVSARMLCLLTIVEDTIDKLGLVSTLRKTDVRTGARSTVTKVMADRRRLLQERTEHATRDLIHQYRAIRLHLEANMATTDVKTTNAIREVIRKEKVRALELLEQASHELLLHGDCPTLLDTVEEEKDTEKKRDSLLESIREYDTGVKKLQAALAEEEARFQGADARVKGELAQLKDRVLDIRKALRTTDTELRRDMDIRLAARRQELFAEEKQLQERVVALREQVDVERKAFKHTQDFLMRKVGKTEKEITEWEGRYERDVHEITEQLRLVTANRNTGLESLKEVEAYYERESAHRDAREQAERDFHELCVRRKQAAVSIQAAFRGFVARRRVAGMEKISDKKKKKKKK